MVAADSHSYAPVSIEATTVFGAAVVIIIVFLVFLLYLNQRWCFIDFRNFPFFCCDDAISKSNRTRKFEGNIFSQPNINSHNLISLAEKGKVGTGSCASSNCSTTSGEDELPKDGALRHRDSRGSGGSNKSRKLAKEVSIDTMNEDIIVPYQNEPIIEPIPMEEPEPEPKPNPNPNPTPNPDPNPQQVEDRVEQTNQEDIFDVTDLQNAFEDHENTPVPSCGCLEVAFAYDAPMRKMTIHMLQAKDIPSRDRGGATHTQVRLLMLPSKKQKHKSKIRSGENPQFMESFLLHRINPEDVNSMGVRFRLYGCERMRRERMIGECIVSFASLNLELETNLWLTLEPRANITLNSSASDLRSLARSDSTSSTHSMQHGGVSELLLGLAYNGTTGRLSVEVVKGSHFSLCGVFKNLSMPRVSDTYVKLSLVSSTGREISRCKTSVRRGQPNPLFKELFMFQVALFQIPDVTLMVSVYMKRSMKRKEMVGWFSLGLNSSGEEELAHWNDMREAKGEQICRWHILIDS